ncbi:ABC transporter ATP-binding protein [Aeromicrobium sp. Root236]|nr:ABC transporter ATP-binding protein [Aeromicrobium sp. Root236]
MTNPRLATTGVEAPRDQALLIESLSMDIGDGEGGRHPLLDDVQIRVGHGETVGLVGESGSGKSLTSRAVLGMVPAGARVSGSVTVGATEVVGAVPAALRALRRHDAAMIFQDARASINPVRTIGDFLTEGLRAGGQSVREAKQTSLRLLQEVGIRDPEAALKSHPHEFSGGMLQRVMIAAALSIEPSLLLADEATTALDVTTQAEVVMLLKRLQAQHRTGLLFVTHQLDLAAAIADRIYVMYAGRIVETATSESLFSQPAHPYTVGLLGSSPSLDPARTLIPIAGRPLALADAPGGCAFRDRCSWAIGECAVSVPKLRDVKGTQVACIRAEEVQAS